MSFTFCVFISHLQLWQGRWQGNEIVVKVLKVRDWTTRKSRDFNEEYPKLRLLLSPDFITASVFCAVVLTHLSVVVVLNQTIYYLICWIVYISHEPGVYVKSFVSLPLFVSLSFCLSLSPVTPSWAPSQDIFSPECSAHVGSMSVSSCPSPHHHHTLDALRIPLQRPAWRHQWVLLVTNPALLTSFGGLCFFLHLSICHYVAITSCTAVITLSVC